MNQAGTYTAEATDATVIESDGGAVRIGFHFVCDDNHGEINGFQCIVLKNGSVNEVGIKSLKEAWPSWDGADPFWFQEPSNIVGVKVAIVLDWEDYNGKQSLRVKYINNPDRPASGLPKSMDRSSFMQRHGARMRAVAGGVAVKAPIAPGGTGVVSGRSATPTQRPAVTKSPSQPAAPAVGSSTAEDAWNHLCGMRSGVDDSTVSAEWTDVCDKISGGKHADQITPQEWFTIKGKFLAF